MRCVQLRVNPNCVFAGLEAVLLDEAFWRSNIEENLCLGQLTCCPSFIHGKDFKASASQCPTSVSWILHSKIYREKGVPWKQKAARQSDSRFCQTAFSLFCSCIVSFKFVCDCLYDHIVAQGVPLWLWNGLGYHLCRSTCWERDFRKLFPGTLSVCLWPFLHWLEYCGLESMLKINSLSMCVYRYICVFLFVNLSLSGCYILATLVLLNSIFVYCSFWQATLSDTLRTLKDLASFDDLWEDAHMGEVCQYLLAKVAKLRGECPAHISEVVATVPWERFWNEPIPESWTGCNLAFEREMNIFYHFCAVAAVFVENLNQTAQIETPVKWHKFA